MARLADTLREARDLLPLLMFAPEPRPATARQLAATAERVKRGADPTDAPDAAEAPADDIARRAGRIAHLVAA